MKWGKYDEISNKEWERENAMKDYNPPQVGDNLKAVT